MMWPPLTGAVAGGEDRHLGYPVASSVIHSRVPASIRCDRGGELPTRLPYLPFFRVLL